MTQSSPEEHWVENECKWEMCRQSKEVVERLVSATIIIARWDPFTVPVLRYSRNIARILGRIQTGLDHPPTDQTLRHGKFKYRLASVTRPALRLASQPIPFEPSSHEQSSLNWGMLNRLLVSTHLWTRSKCMESWRPVRWHGPTFYKRVIDKTLPLYLSYCTQS